MLLVLDTQGIIYSAYYAKGVDLTTIDDKPVGAVYIFVKSLLKLWRGFRPEQMIACLDSPRKGLHRSKIFPGYKGTRGASPEDLFPQVDLCLKILDLWQVPTLKNPEWEADDLIASAVYEYTDEKTIIVTRDKDLCQLVDKVTWIYQPDQTFIKETDVIEKFGVPPSRVAEWLALVGDSSDNIPGVQGIGPKTATSFIMDFPDIVTAAEINASKATGKALIQAISSGYYDLMVELTTTNTTLPIADDFDPSWSGPDFSKTAELFNELGFETLR